GWGEIILTDDSGAPMPKRFNLLALQNGVLADLGEARLPAGNYTQLRLVLAPNSGTDPMANSVVLSDDSELPLTTPSGQQSGLKLKTNITVLADQVADFLIDFDAHKSIQVVKAGASGKYMLRPVIRVMPTYHSAGVAGFLAPTLVESCGQCVTLQKDGVVVQHTTPNSDGRFVLATSAGDGYTLVVTVPGHATAVVTGVPISAGTLTEVNASGNAINPPPSDSGTLDGAVTFQGSGDPLPTIVPAVGASVRVLQDLTAGPTIEVASGWVSDPEGLYGYQVPVGATQIAPYALLPAPLVFAPDATGAGFYSLVASLDGFADQPADLATKLTAGLIITTDFLFVAP
ncbi:MAG: DUF4382 domain-containing protein, partial [Burkholderiaceae bacterium]|nr:DUF4382 domain-containing protein [Burkholderiaceae bacterium]